ncbi:MAG: response regulator [Calditrichaeota bacterium]|nr:response regulator [Calditrichota bacterium]MCB0267647.1 response regulator [Calditrichota bacterium]MCB9070416.1 response regulator [Calditrichia bacterium]
MEHIQKHILIIDDEREVVEILAEYFEAQGYKVSKAFEAKAGIDLLDKVPDISLVISDIGMPGMSGLDFLKIVSETKEEIPIIMITGLKTLDHVITAIRYGAKDYIIKPFKLDEVRKVVEKVLRYRIKSEKKARILEYADALNVSYTFPTNKADPGVIAFHLANYLLNSGFCNKEQFNQYHVAFLETLINAIEHGNLELPSAMKGNDFDKLMMFEELRENRLADAKFGERLLKINLVYNERCFSLTIADEGPGFDWKSYIRNSENGEINTKPYGRGFMLIHHIIDEIYFNEQGNAITLVKSRKNQQNLTSMALVS